jgi:hypothetical protein
MGRTNIKCQNGPVLPPAQVFYFNGHHIINQYNLLRAKRHVTSNEVDRIPEIAHLVK